MNKSNEKQHPTLPMPKDVDTFLVDCRRELEHAVEAHPYFADRLVTYGYTYAKAVISCSDAQNKLDDKVEHDIEVTASDVIGSVITKSTVAWFEGDRKSFSKYMAQSVAVLIRAWQLGLKTMHPAAK